jgi:hypothetical protein
MRQENSGPTLPAVLLLAEPGFDFGAQHAHIGTPLRPGLDIAHNLAHIFYAFGTDAGDGLIKQGINLLIRELGRHILLDDTKLELFLVDQVFAPGILELSDGVTALLDHLVNDSEYLSIVQLDALIHFALLDRREDEANGGQALFFPGTHGGLHVLGDALFQAVGHATVTRGGRWCLSKDDGYASARGKSSSAGA